MTGRVLLPLLRLRDCLVCERSSRGLWICDGHLYRNRGLGVGGLTLRVFSDVCARGGRSPGPSRVVFCRHVHDLCGLCRPSAHEMNLGVCEYVICVYSTASRPALVLFLCFFPGASLVMAKWFVERTFESIKSGSA